MPILAELHHISTWHGDINLAVLESLPPSRLRPGVLLHDCRRSHTPWCAGPYVKTNLTTSSKNSPMCVVCTQGCASPPVEQAPATYHEVSIHRLLPCRHAAVSEVFHGDLMQDLRNQNGSLSSLTPWRAFSDARPPTDLHQQLHSATKKTPPIICAALQPQKLPCVPLSRPARARANVGCLIHYSQRRLSP